MKKMLLFLSLIGMVSYTNAQTGSGTIMIGGGLHFNNSTEKNTVAGSTTDGPKTTSFGINPRVGYFIGENFALGVELGYSSDVTKENDPSPGVDETKNTSSTFSIAPFVRYYSPIAEKAGAFLNASVGYSTGKNKFESTDAGGTTTSTDADISGFDAGITPGLYWFITQKVGLEASFGFIGFSSSKTSDDDDNETKTSNLDFELDTRTIGLGFHYYIGR